MKLIIPLIISAWATVALAQQIDKEAAAVAEVTRYVEWWASCCPRVKRRALKHVPDVVDMAIKYDTDPLLFATAVITPESSWHAGVIGDDGEIGLAQVQPNGACAKGFDLSTREGALEAGASCFREALDKCKNTKNAIRRYNTGSCRGKKSNAGYRYRLFLSAKRRFRR